MSELKLPTYGETVYAPVGGLNYDMSLCRSCPTSELKLPTYGETVYATVDGFSLDMGIRQRTGRYS